MFHWTESTDRVPVFDGVLALAVARKGTGGTYGAFGPSQAVALRPRLTREE